MLSSCVASFIAGELARNWMKKVDKSPSWYLLYMLINWIIEGRSTTAKQTCVWLGMHKVRYCVVLCC